jgi:hypothetical protein
VPSFVFGSLRRAVGEEGLLNTAWNLSTRPGLVIVDYVAGRTIRYLHPVAYLFLATALFAVVSRAIAGPTGAAESDRLFAFLVIPIVAGVMRIFYVRGPYNYAEYLIAATYLAGHALVILTAFILMSGAAPRSARTPFGAAALLGVAAYCVWGFRSMFERRKWLAATAAVAAIVCGTAIWLGALAAVVAIMRR